MSLKAIPLFPLHTVLVPGFPLSLHIFEDRYRQMIADCVRENLSFGVCLIREGEEVGTPAVPFDVGTLAMLAEVEGLPDGRYNVLAMGTQRFRVEEVLPPCPYPNGQVTLLPDEEDIAISPEMHAELVGMTEEYVRLYTDTDASVRLLDVPMEAVRISWLLVYLLQIPARERQALLEEDSAMRRLARLRTLYERELSVLREMEETVGHRLVRPLDADRPNARLSPN